MNLQCKERVWDNGDMIDCGKNLPCDFHPIEEVKAKKVIDAIYLLVNSPFAYEERYTDRVEAISKLIHSSKLKVHSL